MATNVLVYSLMSRKRFVSLALLCAVYATAAAQSGFLLGVDYSEWTDPFARQIATDSSGALYILSDCVAGDYFPPSCVTKLSADGTRMLWRNAVGFYAYAMAVDASGGVYVVETTGSGITQPVEVAKLNSGSGLLWTESAGFDAPQGLGPGSLFLAADASGRAYVAGYDGTAGYIARLDGARIEYTVHLNRGPVAFAVDGTGSAIYSDGATVTRLSQDGSSTIYSAPLEDEAWVTGFAVDPEGGATVSEDVDTGLPPFFQLTELQSFNPSGALAFKKVITNPFIARVMAMDSSGNTYVGGTNQGVVHGVRNSLASCGSAC